MISFFKQDNRLFARINAAPILFVHQRLKTTVIREDNGIIRIHYRCLLQHSECVLLLPIPEVGLHRPQIIGRLYFFASSGFHRITRTSIVRRLVIVYHGYIVP